MSINLNDNIQVNSGKPLDSRYLNGLSAYVSIAAVNSAIPISTRYLGLTMLIGTIEYWYQNAITDVGLIIKSGGSAGTSQPIIRCVYLVADVADATSMGGTAKNTYTTFQTAYDAANALQASLGSNSIVTIMVGNTLTASTNNFNFQTSVGDLTLNANYNGRIKIQGINPNISILGNIVASNNSGSGFSIGTSLGYYFSISDIRLGNITTSATGTTGISGSLVMYSKESFISNINTNITNVLNTLGNGGSINIYGSSSSLKPNLNNVNYITTNSMSNSSQSGSIYMVCFNFTCGTISTATNTNGGQISLNGVTINGTLICNSTSTISLPMTLTNSNIVGNVTISGNIPLSINNCKITSTVFNITTTSAVDSVISNSTLSAYTHNSSTVSRVIITNSNINTLSSNIISSISSVRPYICLYDSIISTINIPNTIVGISNLTNITNTTTTGFRSISIDNITSSLINNITYAEATILATNSLLKVNQYYTITDRGDRGIRLMAVSVSIFSIDGERYMLCPTIDTNISSNNLYGWFSQSPSTTTGLINTTFIHGGKVWSNISNNIGTAIDDFTLSPTDWIVISKSSFTNHEYTQKTFKIKYDFLTDEIYEQSDELGNTVGGYVGISIDLGYNPCDVTDWLCFYRTFNAALSGLNAGTLVNYYRCINNTVQQGIFNNYLNIDYGNVSYLSINDNIKCKKIANNVFTFQTFIENNINCTIYKNNDIDRICNNIGCDLLNNTQPSINTLQIVDCSYYIISNNTSNNGLPMIFNNLTSSYSAGNPYGGQSAITLNTNVNNVNNCIYVTINNCANYGIISNCNNITLSSITSTGITINNVVNLNLLNIIFSTDLPLKNITISNNTIRIFVEYLTILLGKHYMSCIPFDNCRLKSAIISGVGLNTGNYTFGVETDNETYMPATTGTTLNSTPQLINTISSILTKGKRLVINQSTVTVGTKLDAWVELFYY